MNRDERHALVAERPREVVEPHQKELPPYEPPTIHYTELPASKPGDPLYQEWELYRREVGRLLSEGHEGRWILIKGEAIIGIWDTHDEAREAALDKYLLQPCLIHQILTRERVIRTPSRIWRCLG
jgi:hypothetical protein